MQIKRVLAGGLAALTVGASLAFGVFGTSHLQNYVMTTDHTLSSPAIVIGSSAGDALNYPKDVAAAGDIAAHIAGYATTSVAVGGGAVTTVTGGVDLSTASNRLYFGSAIDGSRSTLTNNELPQLLAAGELQDASGTTYKYNQYIRLKSKNITFGTSGESIDPILLIQVGTDSTSQLYNTSVIFSNPIQVATSTGNGTIGKTIKLFGGTYTIGSGSSATKLILFGGANAVTMEEGQERTITVEDVEHTVKVIGVSSATQVVMEVDGISDTFDKGASKTVSGSKGKIDVYVDNVFFFSKQGQISSAKFILGAGKITLEHNNRVKLGTQDTPIDGTQVLLTGTASTNRVSGIEIATAMQKSEKDHIAKGASFTDPVWKSFKTIFGDSTPSTRSADADFATRSEIKVFASGDRIGAITMKDYRGNAKTLNVVWDTDASTSSITARLADSSNRPYHVVENDTIMKNEYFVVAQNEFSRLFQLSDIRSPGDPSATDQAIVLTDVFDSSTITISLDSPLYESTTAYIDGQSYIFFANNASTSGGSDDSISVTWGPGAGVRNPGSDLTVFPVLYGKNGEAVVLLANATFQENQSVRLPGGNTGLYPFALNGTAGTQCSAEGNEFSIDVGHLRYTVACAAGSNATIWRVGAVGGSNVSLAQFPAVMIVEEKTKDPALSDVRDAVIVPYASVGTTTVKIGASTSPTFTAAFFGSMTPLNTNSNKQWGTDRWGTLIETDSTGSQTAMVWYPADQATMNAAVGENPEFATATGTGGTVKSAIQITSQVVKLDNEVPGDSTLTTDLILVGGPCANSLVEKLAADNTTGIPSCSGWTLSTGLIKEVTNAFGSGKKALVVAGNTATDTRNLALQLVQGTKSFSA